MRDLQAPGRSVVMGTRGMVATSHPLSTSAGLAVLREGGNAMDAAIAAAAVQCVVEPFSTGIGGDVFLLYYEAHSGRTYGLNGSGTAPTGADCAALLAQGFTHVPARSVHSVTVPGAVAAWEAALNRFGSRALEALLAPSIAWAEEGYPITPVVGEMWRRHELLLRKCPFARAQFLDAEACAPATGTVHRQPLLAQTLRRIAREGAQGFYQGEVASEIVRFMRQHGSGITHSDLATQRSEWVEPIRTPYHDLEICELPPNGQGITVLWMLNMLRLSGVPPAPRLSAEHVRRFVETYRRALAQRDRHVADLRFAQVPLAELLAHEFSAQLAQGLFPAAAQDTPRAAAPGGPRDTIYLATVDASGNACSFIQSLYEPFGSGLVAGKSGVLLQNRAECFTLQEGHPNALAPGKRPLHTIIPALACRNGRAELVFGVMGGAYQPMGHAYLLSNWLEYGLDLQEAVDAPRFLPVDEALHVEHGLPAETCADLVKMGYALRTTKLPFGGAQAIHIAPQGVLSGASDSRKDGCALGY